MERGSGLQVIKFTDKMFMRILENSIQFGIPVLLENVVEELDPSIGKTQTISVCISKHVLGDSWVPYWHLIMLFKVKLNTPRHRGVGRGWAKSGKMVNISVVSMVFSVTEIKVTLLKLVKLCVQSLSECSRVRKV